jgi:ribosomal protein L11 methyltransferase
MQCLELKFNISKDYLELFSDKLLELGAEAITESSSNNESIFQLAPDEQPKWDNITLTVLFPTDSNLYNITEQIHSIFTSTNQAFNLHDIITNKISNLDWQENYKKYLRPMQFGKRLWIYPSWQSIPQSNTVNVILDPGLAFGTGTHETTSLCLTWLEEHIHTGISIVDYGCGSGILAIAALKLGASQAYAIDIDPTAIAVTQENARTNAVSIYACLPTDLQLNDLSVDVVIANILATPLTVLTKTLSSLLKPRGTIVLSGILHSQEALVTSSYAQFFTDFVVEQNGEWLRISAIKC